MVRTIKQGQLVYGDVKICFQKYLIGGLLKQLVE